MLHTAKNLQLWSFWHTGTMHFALQHASMQHASPYLICNAMPSCCQLYLPCSIAANYYLACTSLSRAAWWFFHASLMMKKSIALNGIKTLVWINFAVLWINKIYRILTFHVAIHLTNRVLSRRASMSCSCLHRQYTRLN